MIAITGASGQLGRQVIDELLKKVPAGELVALARRPERLQDLSAKGVQVREADYDRPETLSSALRGVRRLLLVSSSEVGRRLPQHQAVLEAARKAGVGLLAYTSLLHADRSPMALAPEHAGTEAALKASGLPWVILRNGWYTENYTGSIPPALARGVFPGSAAQGRIASASRADYAAAAAAVLLEENPAGRTYELAGSHAYSLTELAAEIARQSGKPVVYQDLPEADYRQLLREAGLPEGLASVVADSDAWAAQGALDGDGADLQQLLGRESTPMAASVAAALQG